MNNFVMKNMMVNLKYYKKKLYMQKKKKPCEI